CLIGGPLGAAACRLLLVEKGRNLVCNRIVLGLRRLGRALRRLLFLGRLAIRRLGGLRLRRLRLGFRCGNLVRQLRRLGVRRFSLLVDGFRHRIGLHFLFFHRLGLHFRRGNRRRLGLGLRFRFRLRLRFGL